MPQCNTLVTVFLQNRYLDFLGSPVVENPHFQCSGPGFSPGQGTEMPHAMRFSVLFCFVFFFNLKLFNLK